MERRKFITVCGTAIAMSLITPKLLLGNQYECCDETKRLFDVMEIKPDRETMIAWDIWIRDMKKSGAWDKLDDYYNYGAMKCERDSLINWINFLTNNNGKHQAFYKK